MKCRICDKTSWQILWGIRGVLNLLFEDMPIWGGNGFFSGHPAKEVLKGVPPDKSVGVWPSVQEKTTSTGNFGKSPRDAHEDHQGSTDVYLLKRTIELEID